MLSYHTIVVQYTLLASKWIIKLHVFSYNEGNNTILMDILKDFFFLDKIISVFSFENVVSHH